MLIIAGIALAMVSLASCKPNTNTDPTPEPPHWQASLGSVSSCEWKMVTRDDEPSFMTISCNFPSEEGYMGYSNDYVSVLDANDSVIGLTKPSRTTKSAQLYIVPPSSKSDLGFRLCFYSSKEQSYYCAVLANEDAANKTFENQASIGSISDPHTYEWARTGHFTHVAPVSIYSVNPLQPTDEIAIFVNGECRTTTIVSNWEYEGMFVYDMYVPLEKKSQDGEVKIYTQAKGTIETSKLMGIASNRKNSLLVR